tara:strand:+ start:377 stop:649 length:273 start_codon:yes stop_codon:yes gene_type:complete
MNKIQNTIDVCDLTNQGYYTHQIVGKQISGGQAESYGSQTSYSTLATYDVSAVIFSLAYTIVKDVFNSAKLIKSFAKKPRLDTFCVKFTF